MEHTLEDCIGSRLLAAAGYGGGYCSFQISVTFFLYICCVNGVIDDFPLCSFLTVQKPVGVVYW